MENKITVSKSKFIHIVDLVWLSCHHQWYFSTLWRLLFNIVQVLTVLWKKCYQLSVYIHTGNGSGGCVCTQWYGVCVCVYVPPSTHVEQILYSKNWKHNGEQKKTSSSPPRGPSCQRRTVTIRNWPRVRGRIEVSRRRTLTQLRLPRCAREAVLSMPIVLEAGVWNRGSYLGPESLWAWGSWTNAMRLGDSRRWRWEGKWHFCTGWLAGKQQPKRRLGCQKGNLVFQFLIKKKKL